MLTTLRRTATAVALVAAVVLGARYLRPRGAGFRLPPHLSLEETVADLSTELDRHAVVREAVDAPVRVDGLQPSAAHDPNGGYRRVLVAPPPAHLRFRLSVPVGGALKFGVGVRSPGKRDPAAVGVRFMVDVDGRRVYSRVVNPAARRRDRRWFDERIELGAAAGREVEVALLTEPAGPGRLAGTPAWSQVRLVRETERARQAGRPGAPNVVILLVDTLRADHLGCYGADPSPSPTLDRLAAEGLLFAEMIAPAPYTMPSVATLFTGLHPRSHGAWQGKALSGSLDTLAELAGRAGVTTVGISASPLVTRGVNFAQGFETFVELERDQRTKSLADAAAVNSTFLGWLAEHHGLRFLAYLHYMEPHDPYTPPADLRPSAADRMPPALAAGQVDAVAKKINKQGAPLLATPVVEHLRSLYEGEIRSWDRELAGLLDGLAALGLRESTVIVMTADHGEEFQEHGRLKHGLHLYEEQIRVPLVIAGPAIRRARIVEQAQGIDLFPTVATLLGLGVPAGLPGQDLLGRREARPAFSETRFRVTPGGAESALVSLRTARWKLIHGPEHGQFELYDLTHDPAERENRFDVTPEGAALAAELVAWQPLAQPPPPAARDPQLLQKLRALGYVE